MMSSPAAASATWTSDELYGPWQLDNHGVPRRTMTHGHLTAEELQALIVEVLTGKVIAGIGRFASKRSQGFAACYPELLNLYAIPDHADGGIKSPIGKMNGMGLLAGMPDLCLPVRVGDLDRGYGPEPFGALYLDVKTKDGKLSKDQKAVIASLHESGNAVTLVRSPWEATAAVACYLRGEWPRRKNWKALGKTWG